MRPALNNSVCNFVAASPGVEVLYVSG